MTGAQSRGLSRLQPSRVPRPRQETLAKKRRQAVSRNASPKKAVNGDSQAAKSDQPEKGGSTGTDLPSLVCLADVEIEFVDWIWSPYLPKRKLTVIEGDPGVGKSWLTNSIAAAISASWALPGQSKPTGPDRVLILSAEDGLGDTIRPRCEALGATLKNIIALDEQIILNKDGWKRLEAAIKTTMPTLVIIDPLVAYLGGEVDMYRANQMRVIMRALADLAAAHGCAILVVRHLRKSRGGQAIYQGQGSIDITAAARSVLMVGDRNGVGVMAHAKCNLARLGASLSYEKGDNGFRWLGEVSVTAYDLAAEHDDRDARTALEEAKDFLREVLANGRVPSKELIEQADQLGISKRTLRRARSDLGVRAEQVGNQWYASMPSVGQCT